MQLNTKKIKSAIKEQGRTQVWVAKQSGYSLNYLRVVLCGAHKPSHRFVDKLAEILGTNSSEFYQQHGT